MMYSEAMTIEMGIGEHLARTRRASGMTQAALARKVETSQQQVARWEATGYRAASLGRVERVAAALGIDLLPETAGGLPLAAEAASGYGSPVPSPVRDLADVVVRLRDSADELRERFGVRRLGVYGSFTSGTERDHSDVDLLAELDRITFDTEFGAAARIEEILGRKVDLALPSELRASLRDRVDAEVLWVLDA
jgi:predicted nucleotidyltransferase